MVPPAENAVDYWRITMKQKILCIAFLLSVSLFFLSADEKVKLLIAVDPSDFKTKLSDEVITLAKAEGFEVTIRESVKKIQGWSLEEFDALIVINTGMAGRMNRKLTKVLEGGEHPAMAIVTSYGDPKSSKDNYNAYDGVDGLSTASLKSNTDISRLASEILAKVRNLLK